MSEYTKMREVTHSEYREFLKNHEYVVIEDVKVPLPKKHDISKFGPVPEREAIEEKMVAIEKEMDKLIVSLPPDAYPSREIAEKVKLDVKKIVNGVNQIYGKKEFALETTTVWSFPDRGDWATHLGDYRGNWSPYIPRNLILRYTEKNDLVLDQMIGSGTTLVECKLLQRNAIGVDINPDAVMVARNRLDFEYKLLEKDYKTPEIKTYVGDARNLDKIKGESIDLIATHPPYASIIPYSHERVEGDLSSVHDIAEFAEEMKKVARESYRVLKPGKHCAILIGNTRRHKHFVPITPRVLQSFLDAGFILREDIIKMQWKMKSTRERWRGNNYDFLLIAHEHLYVFRKPEKDEKTSQFKESMKW